MGKEIVLPFTCKQLLKVFIILKWVFLCSTILALGYSLINNHYSFSSDTKLYDYPIFSYGFIGGLTGWISQGIFWLVGLALDDKFPSFRCKCENDQRDS